MQIDIIHKIQWLIVVLNTDTIVKNIYIPAYYASDAGCQQAKIHFCRVRHVLNGHGDVSGREKRFSPLGRP